MLKLPKFLRRKKHPAGKSTRKWVCSTGSYRITYNGGGRILEVKALGNSVRYQSQEAWIRANKPALRRAGFSV